MAPPDLSTYRPAIILLAGVTATLTALFLHQQYLKPASPASDGGLHRSNAVRRPHARRRRQGDESGSSMSSGSVAVSELAISRLLAREASGTEYGTYTPSATGAALLMDALPEFRLLPSQFPSVSDLLSRGSMPEIAAREIQHRIQGVFMYTFLEQEYPDGHLIQGVEAEYLREQLTNLNVDFDIVSACIADFNAEQLAAIPTAGLIAGVTTRADLASNHGLTRLTEPLLSIDGVNDPRRGTNARALDTRETVADDQSRVSHQNASDGQGEGEEGQDVMSLVYRVAEDNSKRMNYVHRGVMCNGCRVQPIQGIRYSCANCPDYDLCEDCEANQIHIKTHIFYKVRIPAPLLGYHRPIVPTWYPGKPHLLTEDLREKFPNVLKQHLAREYNMESDELQAHWDQFICLATCSWTNDPLGLGVAIDQYGFDKCFCPPTSLRSPPPNLIYDRLFAFYDTNNDGKIGFEEFLRGLVNLKDNSRHAKLRRIFEAYDLDNDGFVCRKDFLRLFRAYYSYSKEMALASVAVFDVNHNDPYARDVDRDEVRRKVEGGRPISAIFEGSVPAGRPSRNGVGKSLSPDANGDPTLVDNDGVLDESDEAGNHNDAIGEAAVAALGDRPIGPGDADTHSVLAEDLYNTLGQHAPPDEVADPVDRASVLPTQFQRLDRETEQNSATIRRRAIHDRWKKRKFFTDEEEGATAPAGYVEADSSDDDADHENGAASPDSISDSRRRSLRSRSSSKVRFEDDITDIDYETRSNTSSRSIPVGERWGGYEIRDVEKDIGKEVLYQAIQQGFNELLEPLFKEIEDLAIAADETRALRRKWAERSNEHIKPEPSSMLAEPSHEALPQDLRQTCGDLAKTLHHETAPPSVQSSSSDLDPTMPQNRPNPLPPSSGDAAHDSPVVSPTTSQKARLAALNDTDPQATSPKSSRPASQHLRNPVAPIAEQKPPAETLALWAKHDEADAEAKKRGLSGTLDFNEFSRKMVEEEDPKNAPLDEDENKDEGQQKWEKSAGLGRLWFVGTWIEQAAF